MSQNPYIEKLLEELRSEQNDRRIDAIWLIGTQKITDEKIIEALRTIALHDSYEQSRQAARDILDNLGFAPHYETKSSISSVSQQPNIDTEKLLEGLRSQRGDQRIDAVWNAGAQKITDKRVIETLKTMALYDSDYQIRKAAYKTLGNLGFAPEYEFKETDSPSKFKYGGQKSRTDFWYGIGFWIVVNIVMGLCNWGAGLATNASIGSEGNANPLLVLLRTFAGFLPYIVNIGAMIYFVFRDRPQVSLGILTMFGVVLLIVLCLGLFLMAACFVPGTFFSR